jgi:hypothetical protein
MIFAAANFFSFFSWSEIQPISPQRAGANRLLVASWHVGVGRYGLNFAPGVVQNSLHVGQNSSGASKFRLGAHNYWLWVLRICSDLDTLRIYLPFGTLTAGGRRAPVAQVGSVSRWLAAGRLRARLQFSKNARPVPLGARQGTRIQPTL